MHSSDICIFDFLDVIHFLNTFFEIKKNENPSFSQNSWAKEIGFSNKTILRLVLIRKRKITPRSMALFKKDFKFNQKQENYFDLLVAYSNANEEVQRQALSKLILKSQRENFTSENLSSDNFVLNPVYSSIILTIINSSLSALNLTEVSRHCGLAPENTRLILDDLTQAELINSSNGTYSAKMNSFKIQDEQYSQNLKQYYQHWLKKSAEAINLPFKERRFRSLQLAVNEDEFQKIVELSNEFSNQVLGYTQNNNLDDRKIYLFNTSFFPVKDL